MTALADFLLARIAEDEEAAEEMTENGRWVAECGDEHDHSIVTLSGRWTFGPARLLAECETKRRIVEEHSEGRPWSPAQSPGRCRVCTAIGPDGGAARFRAPCPTLRLLALPYADHPDYREEWRA